MKSRNPRPAPRRQRSRARRPRSRVWRWLTWPLAASLGLAAGLFGWTHLMEHVAPERTAVVSLQISGNRRVPPSELVALCGVIPGTPLGSVDLEGVAARIRRHPWIAQVRVTALPPERLLVGVEERTPRALTRLGDELHYVDGGGVPFAPAPAPADIPELVGAEAAAQDLPSPALVEGIQILDALAREGLPAPLRIEVGAADTGERPAFEWRRGQLTQRVVLGAGGFAEKLARLARLLRADLSDAREAIRLDLRFAGRVILRQPEPDPSTRDEEADPEGDA
ncbi:MAG: hypothetical protein CL910_06835 [Deltaproteobacteria bacterium]|nr:hypothetical protein [Deltaproteobacteria bacterium]